MIRFVSAVGLCVIAVQSVMAQCNSTRSCIWLSPSNQPLVSGLPSTVSKVPDIYKFASEAGGSVYVWGRPASGQTLRNWSLNLGSKTAGAITFSGSTVYNPQNGGVDRWEYVSEPTGDSDDINAILAFTLLDPNTHGVGISDATSGGDPLYDASIDAWLLAKIDYTFAYTIEKSTTLFLQIGTLGMNYDGQSSTATDVVFGDATETALNAGPSGDRNTDSSMADATIHILATPDAEFDGDTFVTGLDFLIWQRNHGTAGPQSSGDATGDGNIGEADLAAWELQLGDFIPLVAAQTAVPEPTTLGLAGLAALGLLSIFRRSAQRTR